MCVIKLREGSNWTWKLRQINLVQVILEAHDNDKSTRKRQQCKWISSLFVSGGIQTQFILQMVFPSGAKINLQVISSKWYS
jgi:hypothetical protein